MDLVCLYIYYFIFFRANKGILFLICHHKNANAFFHVNRIIFKSLVNQISFFFPQKIWGIYHFPWIIQQRGSTWDSLRHAFCPFHHQHT